jgi:cathepsin L
MKSVLGTAALSAIVAAQDLITFESFVELHARTYQQGSAEFEQRKSLYQQRLEDSKAQNSSPEKTWTAGVNKLWDWTDAELQTLRGWDGSMMPEGSGHSIKKHSTFLQQSDDLPKEKMWNTLDTFAYVKNQGDCGSCWAIASATVLEAHHEIYTGNHRIFSTQQIVECTPNPRHCGGDGGCKGATAELAMDWVLKNGIADASQIPYKARDGTCTMGSATATMKAALLDISAPVVGGGGAAIGMTGWTTLPKNEYEPLLRALAENGPAAVSVAADTWFNYESGIFNGCSKDAIIDHAVTAIGYGEENGKKYWAIQNSWGADWGEEGIIRLERHDESAGFCGMNNDPQKGVACQGETAPVPVCGMCGVLFDSVVPHFKGLAAK